MRLFLHGGLFQDVDDLEWGSDAGMIGVGEHLVALFIFGALLSNDFRRLFTNRVGRRCFSASFLIIGAKIVEISVCYFVSCEKVHIYTYEF